MLAAILTFLLHVMLIGSMVAFVGFSVMIAIATRNPIERWIRFGAMFCGALVVLGARAAGASYSHFLSEVLTSSGLATATLGVVVPGALGAGLGGLVLLLLRAAYRGHIFLIRLIIFVSILAGTQFAETYVYTLEDTGFALSPAVVPNISFVVGILLCIALTFDPTSLDRSRDLLRRLQTPEGGQRPPGERPSGAEPR